MIKLLLIVLGIILCLLACTHTADETAETASPPIVETITEEPEPEEGQLAMVEWIDFVKYNGQTYEGDWGETTVPLENVGKLLGYIENSVPSEIRNFEEYTVPDNASPYCSVGTPFYAVTNNENAIAVYTKNKDTYYLYQIRE
ncbi:MAG: hypothetical protein E7579_01500 [Ruminococcaceae bacterium]|nr:hypothetical protein [Oscillospiraceae bacterium]